jgi:hypothetical protein
VPNFEFVVDGKATKIIADGWYEEADGRVLEMWRDPTTGSTKRVVGRYAIDDPKRNIIVPPAF